MRSSPEPGVGMSPWRAVALVCVGLGACAADGWIQRDFPGAPWSWRDIAHSELGLDLWWSVFRAVIAAIAVVLSLRLGVPRSAFGLIRAPRQPVGYWLRAGAALAVVAAVCMGIAAAVFAVFDVGSLAGGEYRDGPGYLLGSWVLAPTFEELVYRFILVTTFAAAIGRWPALAVSTVVFAAIHLPTIAPNHIAAGAILGWAYLRSGTLVVPVALHALGNVLVWISLALL